MEADIDSVDEPPVMCKRMRRYAAPRSAPKIVVQAWLPDRRPASNPRAHESERTMRTPRDMAG